MSSCSVLFTARLVSSVQYASKPGRRNTFSSQCIKCLDFPSITRSAGWIQGVEESRKHCIWVFKIWNEQISRQSSQPLSFRNKLLQRRWSIYEVHYCTFRYILLKDLKHHYILLATWRYAPLRILRSSSRCLVSLFYPIVSRLI